MEPGRAVLDHYTEGIRRYLVEEDTIELALNRPGELYRLAEGRWTRIEEPKVTKKWVEGFVKLLRGISEKRLDAFAPILSATFKISGSEKEFRIEILIKPAAPQSCFSIRSPSSAALDLSEMERGGTFQFMHDGDPGVNQGLRKLLDAYTKRDTAEFLRTAVLTGQNIVISGETASGKTTLAKALVTLIRMDERIISVEDTDEMRFPQGNHVKLYYGERVSAAQLIKSCLRLNPNRIILAELRGPEAYSFLRAIGTGHDGSMTTIHARNARQAVSVIAQLVKGSDEAAAFSLTETVGIVQENIDLVLHMKNMRVVETFFAAEQRIVEALEHAVVAE